MTKARDLADLISTGNPLADGAIAASEVSGLATVATSGAYSDLSGSPNVDSLLPSQSGNADKFLTTNGSASSWTEIASGGSADFVASGAIANGDVVILNANGTVSKVSSVSQSSGVGSAALFSSNAGNQYASAFVSTNNKVIVAYRDEGNSNTGYCTVGSLSGSTISFGTPVQFTSNEVYSSGLMGCEFDPSTGKVIIAYRDSTNSGYGTAIVGSISGTTVSFGSAVVFRSGNIEYPLSTFDTTNNKIIIIYRDMANNGYGTAIVGSVSGSSLSFGSAQTIGNTSTWTNPNSVVFDSFNNKVVVVYRNDSKGKASVGSVSGTSVSFGAEVIIENSGAIDYSEMAFDPVNNKILLAYYYSNQQYAVVGSVSGNSVSFGTKNNFAAFGYPRGLTYDTGVNKLVIFTQDSTNSNFAAAYEATISGTSVTVGSPTNVNSGTTRGTSVFDSNVKKTAIFNMPTTGSNAYKGEGRVYTASGTVLSPTVTSSNYVGLATAAIADTATGSITINGGINESQSSLAVGTTYYVADNGTLQTTNNGRKIGKAISATKILVNSNMSGDEMNAYLGGLV